MTKATRKSALTPQFVLLFILSCCGLAACAAPEEMPLPLDSDGDGIYDPQDICPNSAAGIRTADDGCPRDSDGDGVPDYLDDCPDTDPGAAACAYGCSLRDPIIINLVNDEFDFDKYNLKHEMKLHLDGLIDRIDEDSEITELTVVGHTDYFGSDEYNQALSLRRAQSVVNYLKANGLGHLQFHIMGKGETEPMADSSTEEGRAQNRRVEIFSHTSAQH